MNLPLKQNKIMAMTTSGNEACPYYMFVPKIISENPKILVSVHGITRNAIEHCTRFAEVFDLKNTILIVPLFTRKRFKHYQKLRADESGLRPSDALDLILGDVEDKFGYTSDKFILSGYSGGGQFAHRYAMLYPERIQKLVLMAPGWYTFPDASKDYPEGTKTKAEFKDLQFYSKGLLSFPIEVIVGERDVRRDKTLNRTGTIDQVQGRTRLQRSQSWVEAVRRLAKDNNMIPNIKLAIISGAGHDFQVNFSKRAFTDRVRNAVFDL